MRKTWLSKKVAIKHKKEEKTCKLQQAINSNNIINMLRICSVTKKTKHKLRLKHSIRFHGAPVMHM